MIITRTSAFALSFVVGGSDSRMVTGAFKLGGLMWWFGPNDRQVC